MSALPSRPPSGGPRQWTRGGATSAIGGGPLARNQSVVFNAAGAAIAPPSAAGPSGNGSRGRGGAARGTRGSSRGRRGGGGGGDCGGRANALELAGALGDDDTADDSADLMDGFEAPAPAEDTEETKVGKADARLQRFTSKFEGNRFEELRKLRGKERADAMRSGAIDDPSVPRQLNAKAKAFVGTCEGMCPEFEIEEREAQFNVDRWELLEGTTNRIDHAKAVKMYHRPAAGNEQPLPSDVRTPEALRRSLDYLFTLFPPAGPPAALRPSHGFVRDRTRAIRQDFTIQSSKGAIAIECHERMARYHIHCLHALGEEEGFSVQQEMEQLRKILTSLIQFYTDVRNATPSTSTSFDPPSSASPHEAEFSAYLLLTHLFDSDILRQTESLPPYLFHSTEVQLALELAYLAQRAHDAQAKSKPTSELSQNFFSRFFKVVGRRSTPYLVGALVEGHFGEVRKAALCGMRKAFLSNHKALPADDLVRLLGADDEADLRRLIGDFGVEFGEDGVRLSKETVITDNRQAFHLRTSRRVVGAKAVGWSNIDIINGLASKAGSTPAGTAPTRRSSPCRSSPSNNAFGFGSAAAETSTRASSGLLAEARESRSTRTSSRASSKQPSLPSRSDTGTPADISLPTPIGSAFASPAPIPKPKPTPPLPVALPTPSTAFAIAQPSNSVLLPPAPATLSASSVNPFSFNAPSTPSTPVPLTAAQKGKGREPPRRFQEVLIASPSDSPSSAAATPPTAFPVATVTSSAPVVLEPLLPPRAPRPRQAADTLTLNGRLARSLTNDLITLATASTIRSICSRVLSQEVIDRLEAEDLAREREREAFEIERQRRLVEEAEEAAAIRRSQVELAHDVYERGLKRRTLAAMWEAVLLGRERRDREVQFELSIADMGLGRSVTRAEVPLVVASPATRFDRSSRGPALGLNTDYRETDNRIAELGKSRAAFWEHSTFLYTLLDHLSVLATSPEVTPADQSPPPIQLDILLSTVPLWKASNAGSWLSSKLGLKKGRQESDRVRGQGVQLRVCEPTAVAGSQEVALVIFECSPPSAPTGDEEDAERLKDVLAAVDEDNQYRLTLLIIGWTPSLTPVLSRKLRNPGMPAYHLLVLDTAEADEAFASAVETFVRIPPKVERPLIAVQSYLAALQPAWEGLLGLGLDLIDHLDLTSPSVPRVIDQLLAAINDYTARIVAAVSATQRVADELYLPHFAPSTTISDHTSLASALLEYLELSRFTDDFAYGPLRGDVRRAFYGNRAPPLRAFFEALFASTSSPLEALPHVPERKFGDPRGIDEAATGFAEYVNDIETELVQIGNTQRQARHVDIDHHNDIKVATPARPDKADEQPRQSLDVPNGSRSSKRPREPSDDDDAFAVDAPVSVDRTASCSGAAHSKFAKLRKIMAAARGII